MRFSEQLRQQGMQQGIQQGVQQGLKTIAKKLLTEKMAVEKIAELTELSIDEILALQK